MSDTTFSMNAIKEAFPVKRFGSVKSAQYEAFRFLSRCVGKDMTMRRVRSIWEGTARRIDGEEKDALRRATLEETRREQQFLRKRLAELDAALAANGQMENCTSFPEVR